MTDAQRAQSAGADTGRITLFTAVKNEAPFLLEWIAYHRVIGFDRIIVFSNDCDDGTDTILNALAEAGVVEHHTHSPDPGISAQANAARIANGMSFFQNGDWVAWLDADEFLVSHVGGGRVGELIQLIGPHDGILVPWRVMGDGGNDRFPGRFISPSFTAAAATGFEGNLKLKTLFRYGPHVEGLGTHAIHRPKLVEGGDGSAGSFLMATGKPVDADNRVHRKWLDGLEMSRNCRVAEPEHGYDLGQINHYSVRTPEHFALKRTRGRGWAAGETAETNTRHNAQFYREFNRADVEDRRILRFEAEVTSEIANLRTLPGVTQAETAAMARVDAQISRIPQAFIDDCLAERRALPGPKRFDLTLPTMEAELLLRCYAGAETILEYGSGGSSFRALELGVKALFTVESDRTWAFEIGDALTSAHPDRMISVYYADIGETGAWGKPKGTEGQARYHLYANGVWDLPQFRQPDVALVDGRFRVACFLTILLRSRKPVTVLFDDYANRANYHWIEDYVTPAEIAGRMARFELEPTSLPPEDLTRFVGAFSDPA